MPLSFKFHCCIWSFSLRPLLNIDSWLSQSFSNGGIRPSFNSLNTLLKRAVHKYKCLNPRRLIFSCFWQSTRCEEDNGVVCYAKRVQGSKYHLEKSVDNGRNPLQCNALVASLGYLSLEGMIVFVSRQKYLKYEVALFTDPNWSVQLSKWISKRASGRMIEVALTRELEADINISRNSLAIWHPCQASLKVDWEIWPGDGVGGGKRNREETGRTMMLTCAWSSPIKSIRWWNHLPLIICSPHP